ncbi:MAG: hypothetical protein OXQ31_06070 [Spirochaetaceae bacterium]|nr:hypothetical protein [Spirochaetaceae bacterium]
MLTFHPERTSDQNRHPLRGLLDYGPYSSGFVPDPIRIATVAPRVDNDQLYTFMRELNKTLEPQDRKDYVPVWPGFQRAFNLRMSGAGGACHVNVLPQLDSELQESAQPHVTLAEHLIRAIQSLEARRTDFDIVFIYIPARWERGFEGPPRDDFDLHDHLKAYTAARGLPIQLVREDRAISYHCRASVMWRIGLALYVKAGGVPWKIADSEPDTAYIGISYAVRPVNSDRPRFVTCCSQVLDSDGSGLEFIAYDAQEVEVHRDNPFLSRNEMFRVMTRSMDLYRRRHAGRSPRRVMVHKTTEFKAEEVAGCMEALHLCEAVDLVQVVEHVDWRGVRIDPGSRGGKGLPAKFPVPRGTLVGLGPAMPATDPGTTLHAPYSD